MKRILIIAAISWVALAVIVYSVLIGMYAHHTANLDMNDLLYQSVSGAPRIYPGWMTDVYLFNFRGDQEDLENLKLQGGLNIITYMDSTEKADVKKFKKYLAFFKSKGFQIDTPNNSGKTTLHSAIDTREIEFIKILLEAGADPKAKVGSLNYYFPKQRKAAKYTGLNALQFAMYQEEYYKQNKNMDYSEVIKILEKAKP